MFNISDFKKYGQIIPFIEDLNSSLVDDKLKKLNKICTRLLKLKRRKRYFIPLSYIFSILAEDRTITLPDSVISSCITWLISSDNSVKVNSIAIIGLCLEQNKIEVEKAKEIYPLFFDLLVDKCDDVRDNAVYFLLRLKNKIKFSQYYEKIIQSLKKETSEQNISALLEFLSMCNEVKLEIDQFIELRNLLYNIIEPYKEDDYPEIWNAFILCIELFFPPPNEMDTLNIEPQEMLMYLQDYVIMTRKRFVKPDNILEYNDKYFRDIINSHKAPDKSDIMLFHITSQDSNELFLYYFEKDTLSRFFNQEKELTFSTLNKNFPDITDKKELRKLIAALLESKRINGYLSKLGTFFSESYLLSLIKGKVKSEGSVHTNSFKFLPEEIVSKVIQKAMKDPDAEDIILRSKDNKSFFSSNHIYSKMEVLAKQHTSLNLKQYQEFLRERDFLRLVQSIPTNYFTIYRRGTHLLTNLGLTYILEKIKNSQVIGFCSISEIAKSLKINKKLVRDVIEVHVDPRSGIIDKTKNVFYYTQFIMSKMNKADHIFDEDKKQEYITKLANELNIDRIHISKTMHDHLVAIEAEIRNTNQIYIDQYMKLTGFDLIPFMEFIESLKIDYLKRGNLLIFNPVRIEQAKNEIRSNLIDRSQRDNCIVLSSQHFEITESLLNTLAQELYDSKKMEGIFYNDGKETMFYTNNGLEELILKNIFHFSFNDLFPGKELTTDEIDLLKDIIKTLLEEEKIVGKFDDELFTFSSHDKMFARDHEDLLLGYNTILSKYFQKFQKAHQKIKEILLSKDSIIRPQTVSSVDKIIKALQSRFDFWRGDIDGYIANANDTLYKRQGLSKEKVAELAEKYNLPSFDSDPQVVKLLTQFREWISLINSIEFRYKSIIFYQKRLKQEPDNTDSQVALKTLLKQLKLV